jgi:hypothetical protein
VLTIPNYARWPSISSPRALLRAAEFSFLLFRFLLLLLLLRFFTSAPVRALADLMEFRKPVWQNVPRACASATSSLRRDNAAPNMGGTLLRDCSLRLRLGTMKRNGTRRAVCSPFSQKKCLLCLTLGDPRERHPNCSLPLRDQERLRISNGQMDIPARGQAGPRSICIRETRVIGQLSWSISSARLHDQDSSSEFKRHSRSFPP